VIGIVVAGQIDMTVADWFQHTLHANPPAGKIIE
jgi:hypothetical protein